MLIRNIPWECLSPGHEPDEHIRPGRGLRVHDKLNEKVFGWKPEWAANYRQYADQFDDGVIEWDGLLLDGWSPT